MKSEKSLKGYTTKPEQIDKTICILMKKFKQTWSIHDKRSGQWHFSVKSSMKIDASLFMQLTDCELNWLSQIFQWLVCLIAYQPSWII